VKLVVSGFVRQSIFEMFSRWQRYLIVNGRG